MGSTELAKYSYESVTNLLKTLAYGNGDSVQYTYDNQGRLTKQTFEDNDTVTYLYDNDGVLSTVIDSASGFTTKYYYDFAGRLVKYTENNDSSSTIDSDDHSVAYVYDEKNQVAQRKSTALGSTWTMAYAYDEDGRITSATQSTVSRSFTYDTRNRLTGTTLVRDGATALTTSYVYKANTAMLSTLSLTNKAGETGSWQYLYDDNGNITRIITTVNGAYKTIYYHYDTAGQLVREDNQKAGTTTLWTYDNAGNLTEENIYAYTTGTPSTLQKTNTYSYTSTQWGDLLTAYNGNMIYYDGMTTLGKFQVGNPTTYYNGTHWEFTWEHGRQLATMTSGGTTWTNTYNSDGLRTSRTDGTTTYTYYYEGGRLSAIKRNDLNMWIIYDENGPVTLKYGVGTFHYVTNPQGDVVAIVGNQGQTLVEYTYDAWGKVTSITGDYAYNLGIHNPILYRGYIYDHETGLYYCQSRYYDPQTHRFLNADAFTSTGQGLLGNNMFAYCGNNPVNRVDPGGGLWGIVAIAVACVLVLTGCSSPTSDYGAAPIYQEMSGSTDPLAPNCYAYAVGAPINMQVGVASGKYPTDWSNVEEVGASVEADLTKLGYSIRRISGPNAKVYDDEYKIALRVGTTPYAIDPAYGERYDYHFMVQTSTGQWAEKHGYGGSSVLHPIGMTPDTIAWSLPGVSNTYYDSPIIYYAIGKK